MGDSIFYVGMQGIMRLLRQIWDGFFSLQFFDAPFTFGDVLIALFFVALGFWLIRFFANSNKDGSEETRKGIFYK